MPNAGHAASMRVAGAVCSLVLGLGFGIPGVLGALHLARTVCRRAERLAVALDDRSGESVSPQALKYLNRLSDLLFTAARWANGKGGRDVLWSPGSTR